MEVREAEEGEEGVEQKGEKQMVEMVGSDLLLLMLYLVCQYVRHCHQTSTGNHPVYQHEKSHGVQLLTSVETYADLAPDSVPFEVVVDVYAGVDIAQVSELIETFDALVACED